MVATFQVMRNRMAEERWDGFRGFGIVVVDEAHHSTAETFRDVLVKIGAVPASTKLDSTQKQVAYAGNKVLIGFTGTPDRDSGDQINTIYQELVVDRPYRVLAREGWVVPIRSEVVFTNIDLSKVRITSAGRYDEEELDDAVEQKNRRRIALKAWLERAEGRCTLAYTTRISEARKLARLFRAAGVRADYISGDMPPTLVEAIKAKFGAGELDVLFNVSKLTEGFDAPNVRCIMILAPTQSVARFQQVVGRGVRMLKKDPTEDAPLSPEDPKQDCLVIDLADNDSHKLLVNCGAMFNLPPKLVEKATRSTATLNIMAEELDRLRRQNPEIDFSRLPSLDAAAVHLYIRHACLFQLGSAVPELANLTHFRWTSQGHGQYQLYLPPLQKYEQETKAGWATITKKSDPAPETCLRVRETLSGVTLTGHVACESVHEIHESLGAAIRSGDAWVRTYAPKRQLRLVDLRSKRRSEPCSRKHYNFAASLLKQQGYRSAEIPAFWDKDAFPDVPPEGYMTKGQADDIIAYWNNRRAGAGKKPVQRDPGEIVAGGLNREQILAVMDDQYCIAAGDVEAKYGYGPVHWNIFRSQMISHGYADMVHEGLIRIRRRTAASATA